MTAPKKPKVKLPDMPPAVDYSDVPSVAHVWGYTADQMREYATAAVLAERERSAADALLMRQAAEALEDLLNDTQHAEHPDCEDGPCPVREARSTLAALRQRVEKAG